MSEKWNSGAPPSDGWWPASIYDDPEIVRWRENGVWSIGVKSFYDAKTAAYWARKAESLDQARIRWQDRPASWPKESRT